jgi:beta-glucosidase
VTPAVRAATVLVLGLVPLLGVTAGGSGQGAAPPYRDAALPVDRRVADLLSRMTLEEKVAQLTSIWNLNEQITDAQGHFSPEKAARVMPHGLGQIARPANRQEWKAPIPLTARQAAEWMNAAQRWALERTRLGIPFLFHEEALHGLVAPGGTHFPIPIGLASTWDTDLVERVMSVAALEARARGAHQVLAPVLDLALDPRWGRTEETFGEDPYLVARLGVAAIRGYQGTSMPLAGNKVFATVKHFAAHGPHEGGINTAPVHAGERFLRDTLLVPFRIAITEARPMSVMPSYNEWDGVPAHASRWLLEDVLRGEWGFDGLVVSDYFGIEELQRRHHVTVTQADAGRLAIEAGVDLELPGAVAYPHLVDEVRAGRLPESIVDRAVARVLRAKFLSGAFDHPFADPDHAEAVTNTPEHQRLALEAARRSIVLLKNDGNVLPLDRTSLRRLAVIGPNAAGVRLGAYSADPGRGISVLQGLRDALGPSVEVVHAEGCRITESDPDWYRDAVTPADPVRNRQRIAEAAALARTAEAIVLVLGGNESVSREAWSDTHLGDTTSLDLPGDQTALVEAVAATGRPVVALLLNGRPYALTAIVDKVPAILEGWYLGQEGGTAAAEVIVGDVNPGGKLPISLPRSVGQLPVHYRRKPTSFRDYLFESRAPLFAFGHGLSYTSFRLTNLRVDPAAIAPDGHATVRVDVTNAGARAGDEVVQLYIRDRVSSVTRPVQELAGFERVTLAPGETRTVRRVLGFDALALHDTRMRRVVEPGIFDVMVGSSSADLLRTTLEVLDQGARR